MNIPPQKLLHFNKAQFVNDNRYGRFIFKQVKEWSDLMEENIPKDSWEEQVEYLRNHASELSLKTDACNGGLSGFQQDCATQILIGNWYYGFELWLGLNLERHDMNFTIPDENIGWINCYLSGDYESLQEYKKELNLNYDQ